MMTGAEFLAYVKRKFIREDKDTEIYQATTDIIADIRLQSMSEDYKEEAYSTGISTLGEYKLGLPTDFGHLIGDITLIDVDSNSACGTLKKISKQRYDEKYSERLLGDYADMGSGEPYEYCIYGKQLFLGPVPDKTTYKYQFNYTTEDYTEVDASTDPVPFSDKYRNYLRAGVLAELHDGLENFEEAQYWRQMYIDGLNKIYFNDTTNTMDSVGASYSGV